MTANYRAYLIRFKRQAAGGHWLASLENVHSRERLQFVTERELLVYLLKTLSEPPAPDAEQDAGSKADP